MILLFWAVALMAILNVVHVGPVARGCGTAAVNVARAKTKRDLNMLNVGREPKNYSRTRLSSSLYALFLDLVPRVDRAESS